MEWFSATDWHAIFTPTIPLLETFVRGSAMFFALFVLLRMVLKRQAGTLGMTDMLVVVLIADAAQNGMAADYHSVPDGIVLVATLVFWNYVLEWLGYHYPWMERIIHPPALPLVQGGRLMRKNMRHELISETDLMTQLRQQGIEDIAQVKRACLEGDGKISVVEYKRVPKKRRSPKQTAL